MMTPALVVCEAEGSDNGPSPNDKPRPRPQFMGLPRLHVSALHQLLDSSEGEGQLPSSTPSPSTLTLHTSSRQALPLPPSQPLSPDVSSRAFSSDTLGSGDISCLPLDPLSHPLSGAFLSPHWAGCALAGLTPLSAHPTLIKI